jgi:hypothetical protein
MKYGQYFAASKTNHSWQDIAIQLWYTAKRESNCMRLRFYLVNFKIKERWGLKLLGVIKMGNYFLEVVVNHWCQNCNGEIEKNNKLCTENHGWVVNTREAPGSNLELEDNSLFIIFLRTSRPRSRGRAFPGGKARSGHDADHSPPSSAKVKYE